MVIKTKAKIILFKKRVNYCQVWFNYIEAFSSGHKSLCKEKKNQYFVPFLELALALGSVFGSRANQN